MNLKEAKKILYKVLLSILFVLVAYVSYCSIFNIYKPTENLQPIVIVLGVIVCIFAFIRLKNIVAKVEENKSNKIAVILSVLFFILLTMFGSKMISIPTYDLMDLQREAMLMLKNGKQFVTEEYFAMWPNNIPVTIFIYYIYKLGTILQFNNLRLFGTIINSLLIAITAFFTYLSVKKLKDYKSALITLTFFIINPAFYMYASYFYTDILCMPFAAVAIYLFLIGMKSSKMNKFVITLIVSGVAIAIGMKIRIVVLFLLIAMILGQFINNKISKKMIISSGCLMIGIMVGLTTYSLIERTFGEIKNKDLEYPAVHWVLMALNEENTGAYNDQDFFFTHNIPTYEGKKQADINMIVERLNKLGLKGWISLTKSKLSRTWSNAEYDYISKLNNVEKINNIYEYIVGNRRIFFLYYAQIFKAVILIVFLFAILKEIIKPDKEELHSIIYISMMGAFAFYLIWEVSTRYSLSFLPWMMLVFGIGISTIEKIFNIKNIIMKDNKIYSLNTDKIRKIFVLCTIVCSIFLIVCNFYKYAIQEKSFWDKRVVQYRKEGKVLTKYASNEDAIPKIGRRVIEQTFKTSKVFNSIAINFVKDENAVNALTNYKFEVYSQDGKKLRSIDFDSTDVLDDTYKTFSFEDIYPKGEMEYTIKIYSVDATEQNSIGLGTFYITKYSAYPDGKLMINEEVTDADLTFKVQNENISTYISKILYIIVSLIIIGIEVFEFYPYLQDIKKDNEWEQQNE